MTDLEGSTNRSFTGESNIMLSIAATQRLPKHQNIFETSLCKYGRKAASFML
jgi:hypothetical protein